MTLLSTTIRATHLVTNAAWFGGSLMAAVGLHPAAEKADRPADRTQVVSTGWERWGPVQGAAMGLHLLSGLAILADNRNRVRRHRSTQATTVVKTVLTAGAVGATAWAYLDGHLSGELAGDDGAERWRSPREQLELRKLRDRLRWLQWVTPALTGAMLVADSALGEEQRGTAGLLDRPFGR
ncbi:hypothetical protein [Pedococcus sp. 5OH_020]|uniref:hypothetical protein n=1 Tax=Pedococcus sp. 5OH_020 TaxID=2989814 RepID=UPI0022E9EE47|nr:hypothetical protein [Pedococcus sp. 5OH_020]